jgi:hypothetical protein
VRVNSTLATIMGVPRDVISGKRDRISCPPPRPTRSRASIAS